MAKTLLVIGNGLDTGLGYPTSYKCFYNFLLKKSKSNGVIRNKFHRVNKFFIHKDFLWKDVESRLLDINISIPEDNNKLDDVSGRGKDIWYDIKYLFRAWICSLKKSIKNRPHPKNKKESTLIRNLINVSNLIFTFNYTKTIELHFKPYIKSLNDVLHIHGSYDNPVLGHERSDKALVPITDENISDSVLMRSNRRSSPDEEYNEFIESSLKKTKKHFNDALNNSDNFLWFNKLRNITNIIFFGVSYSSADKPYYEYISKYLNKYHSSDYKLSATFYCYSPNDVKNAKKFAHFLASRDVNLIDKTKDEFICIGEVPRLRFNKFNDVWKNKQLGDLYNRCDNLRKPVSSNVRIKGNIPYYGANGIEDYVKGYTCNGSYVLIAEDGANSISNYPIYLTHGKFWVNNHAHVLSSKKFTSIYFLAYAFKEINLRTYLVGGGRLKLRSKDLMNINFNIPSLPEQRLIGKFFAKLDKLIQLQQKKVSLLKKLKRGYLQKLFPRKGELVPRLRFKGFHDKWMRKSLKNIVTYINTGKSKRKELCRVCNNTYKYPFISASTLKGYSKTYDYKGMILLCTRVGNVGYLHLVNGKFQISDNTIVIKGKNNLYFIKGLLRTQRFQRIAEGSSQKLIREKELEQFLFLVPRFKEQEKINELFKILNIQIKYQLCKLWNLRRLKKAYLQKMFC